MIKYTKSQCNRKYTCSLWYRHKHNSSDNKRKRKACGQAGTHRKKPAVPLSRSKWVCVMQIIQPRPSMQQAPPLVTREINQPKGLLVVHLQEIPALSSAFSPTLVFSNSASSVTVACYGTNSKSEAMPSVFPYNTQPSHTYTACQTTGQDCSTRWHGLLIITAVSACTAVMLITVRQRAKFATRKRKM